VNVLSGCVVKSLAGHDKNTYAVVLRAEGSNVYLADGKRRKLEYPKRKNVKHVSATAVIISTEELTNKKLRKLLSSLDINE